MLCVHCGSTIPEDAKFCHKCGVPVETNDGFDPLAINHEGLVWEEEGGPVESAEDLFEGLDGGSTQAIPEAHGLAESPPAAAGAPAGSRKRGATGKREEKSIIKKICVIGNPGVGKKTLVGKVAPFNKDILRYTETIGTAITKYLLNYESPDADFKLLLIIWDVTGKDAFLHLHKAYYRGAEGLVIVANGGDPDSLETIPRWMEQAYKVVGEVPTVLIVNKMDQIPVGDHEGIAEQVEKILGKKAATIPVYYVGQDFDFEELKAPFFRVAEMLRDRIQERMKKGTGRRRLP